MSQPQLIDTNLKLIASRWPAIAAQLTRIDIDGINAQLEQGLEQTISVNGIQLSSRHNRIAEASLLCQAIPTAATEIDCYGIGMGDVPWYLLHEKQVQSLRVHCLNLSLLKLLLTYTDQSQWLSHPQLTLLTTPAHMGLGRLWLACTADLGFCDEPYQYQRDIILHEKNVGFANRRHEANRALHLQRFEDNQPFWQHDEDALQLRQIYADKQAALVIASGPSLASHYAWLQQVYALPQSQRPLIIAVDTALKGLMSQQIGCDIVVSIDELITPAMIQAPQLVAQHAQHQSPPALVYFPKSRPDLLASWPGKRYAAYSTQPIFDSLCQRAQHCRLFANGSVLHPAVDLACQLGIKQTYLIGADFGFVDGRTHAAWEDGALGPKVSFAKHSIKNGEGKLISTNLNFISYLRALELFIAKQPHCQFQRLSQAGAAIRGCAYQDPKALLRQWQAQSQLRRSHAE
ncbi:6-hydroxymethylpterin diphosphokinase MptE-like protein [Shewanella sp. NIFS-20-20]|uniref:motility associated factor glycosyltransferase family protein n=1 Tax=Shewanella sp. NIFS-20-20 TaxID=2853806 RepID=UPI001C4916F8|nr:6-hydroxymethylpterin diphosphokinase MptE-like protein [Shewanella sp. NIFS-20-20]MBV7314762.1 DUF115 domain-containing protein [Shewanella sp. NIFS-20-20]